MDTAKRRESISFPEVVLMSGSQMMLGAGLAFLLGDRLTPEQRKATGWSLFVAGLFVRLPLVFQMANKVQQKLEATEPALREVA